MGLNKTFTMDCDKCQADLTDSDGIRTDWDSERLAEFAQDAGWRDLNGWYCAACVVEKQKSKSPGQEGK